MIAASLIALVAAASAFFWRLLRGPSLSDRVIALDGLVVCGMSALVIDAVRTGNGAFLPVTVVFTLVGFVGTSVIARFIEGQGR